MPHRLRHHDRFLEAEGCEVIEQARVFGAGKIVHRRQLRGAGGIALEQLFVMPLHDIEMAEQVLGEGRAAVVAEEAGKTLHGLAIVRQAVGLLVGDHLQPVFDPPQEFIRCGQLVTRGEGDPVARSQHLQGLERRPHPQFGMPATGDQLLGLGEEFDFADAAAPDLDVVALDRDLALSAVGLHLPLHVVHVGQGREVQMLAPDERCNVRQQRFAGAGVAGAGPGLDHGGAFPGPPFPLVIMQRRLGRDRHLRRGWIRPQPQIDPEHVAVAGALLQQPRHGLRDAHEERRGLEVRGKRRCGRIEEHDQVDVAGIVQFARAHLAHGEHDQPAVVLGFVRVGRRQPPACGLLPQHKAQRRLHRGDREIGQRRRHLHHRPDAADVSERNQQRGFRFHPPEQLHHVGFACRGRHLVTGPFDQRRQMLLRLAFEQPDQPRGVGAYQVEKIGRGFRDALQDGPGERKSGAEIMDRSRLPRRQIAKPVCQPLLGTIGGGHMRSVHEPRGQTISVRVALRG